MANGYLTQQTVSETSLDVFSTKCRTLLDNGWSKFGSMLMFRTCVAGVTTFRYTQMFLSWVNSNQNTTE